MTSKLTVLFVCTENAARSQMAEVLLREMAGDRFEAYSAGSSPTSVYPETHQALEALGYPHQSLTAKHLSMFAGRKFDYVISLCDQATQECRANHFSGKKLEWHFQDPKARPDAYPFEVTLNEIRNRLNMFINIETQQQNSALEFIPTVFFKNLTDEVRLKCLMLIQYEGELCVCELVAALDEIQPKVSRHLALLKEHGVLTDRRQGQWVFYRINPSIPLWAKTVISETTENNIAFIANALTNLGQMAARPERQATSCC